MYTINKEKKQEVAISTVETKEYHLLTDEGLEFVVRVEDGWSWVVYHTDLSEDGKSILNSFRQLEFGNPGDEPIIRFFDFIDEKLGEE